MVPAGAIALASRLGFLAGGGNEGEEASTCTKGLAGELGKRESGEEGSST